MNSRPYTADDWKRHRIATELWAAEIRRPNPQGPDDPAQEMLFGMENNAHRQREADARAAQLELFQENPRP
jgi:hypothetical protein